MLASSSERSGPVAMSWASMAAPDSAIASSAPSMRGWMFSWPGRGDEQPHLALADDLDDPLAHGEAGPVQVLADVGHPGVRCVGVVGDDRDPGVERLLHGFVERLEIDE